MTSSYIDKILQANVYEVAIKTPLDLAPNLSKRLQNTLLLKREDEQPVFSFKLRGAYNKMSLLSEEEKTQGVVTASAGNHAQGVALAAAKLGITAHIVMPSTTPEIKVNNVRNLGGRVIQQGDTFDQALAYAQKLVETEGYNFIHPYDDPDVIAGQGTIALELLEQSPKPIDAIFVPVGGGGLIAGIAVYIKQTQPNIKIIGVEYEKSACLKAALEAQERVVLEQVGLFADGVAVAQIGTHTFELAKAYVDQVITVSADEICAAIKDIFDDTRSICEPAGALAVAGCKKYVSETDCTNQCLVAIDSGANTNFDRLRHIAERAELGESREAIIAAKLPEKAGSFHAFCSDLGPRNITEFNYRYSNAKEAMVFAGIQTKADPQDRHNLLANLADEYQAQDLTDNEIAKLHVRYMVGGQRPDVLENEVVYRFEFPERPGALIKFLNTLGNRWNISMFHYRNHGAAYGRVLVGMQVPDAEHQELENYLEDLKYPYWHETNNLAYQIFLGDGCSGNSGS